MIFTRDEFPLAVALLDAARIGGGWMYEPVEFLPENAMTIPQTRRQI